MSEFKFSTFLKDTFTFDNIWVSIRNIWIFSVPVLLIIIGVMFTNNRHLKIQNANLQQDTIKMNDSIKNLSAQNVILYNQLQELLTELSDWQDKYTVVFTENKNIKTENAKFYSDLRNQMLAVSKKIKDINYSIYKMQQKNMPQREK